MLAFINANYRKGDNILIHCSEGSVEGSIISVSSQSIILQLPNGLVCGIAASDIRSFTAASPIPMQPAEGHDYQIPAEEQPLESPFHTEAPESAEQPEAETKAKADGQCQSVGEAIGPQKEPETFHTTLPKEESQVKVVGRISLDQLKRMDPRSANRPRFKEYASTDDARASLSNAPFVAAMGRITYYNREKRYGFIRDFQSDSDLYFHNSQVADRKLFDRLGKGTKVAYTMTTNDHGNVALCVHLPHNVDDLLDMADENIEKGYYNLADGLLEHVLAVDPDNADARDMSIEVKNLLPKKPAKEAKETKEHKQPTTADTSLTTNYAIAKKAIIDKDFDRAEDYFKRAIDEEERTPSAVKDLLQVFVMRYKSVETDAEREMWYDEAVKAYEHYRDLLPDDLTTLQFLAANFYLPLQDYEHYLTLTERILEQPDLPTAKRVFYIWQRAMAYQKMNDTDKAIATAREGLAICPTHVQLKNFLHAIEEQQAADAAASAPEGAGIAADTITEVDLSGGATEESEGKEPEATDATADDSFEGKATEQGMQKDESWWNEFKSKF